MISGVDLERRACPRCGGDLSALLRPPGGSNQYGAGGWNAFPLPCPGCSQPSDSIKCYRMGVLLFLLVVGMTWTKSEVGCPSCIRGKIAQFCLVNVVTFNVFWPFIILPWSIIMLLRSFTKGHSKAVLDSLR